jgi:histidine ammonia-lyase
MTLQLTGDQLTLASAARKRVEQSRRCVEGLLAAGATLYGVNTGFGKLSNQRIPAEEVLALQENLLRSHAVGMGPLLDIAVSRLALALRINALAKGYSGVSVALVETLIEMFNRGVVPAIPEQGSVGASGDLAPLAHMALVVMGEGEAFVVNPARSASRAPRPMSGRAALQKVRLAPHRPLAKEGLRSSTARRSARPSSPTPWCRLGSSRRSPTSPAR